MASQSKKSFAFMFSFSLELSELPVGNDIDAKDNERSEWAVSANEVQEAKQAEEAEDV